MSWISRYVVRIGSALLCASLALGAVGNAGAQDRPASAPTAQVVSITISNAPSAAIVDVRMQGSSPFQWHRLRDPDNRFWVDFTNAQLNGPPRDDTEPDPLGGLRVRQIAPSTVRLALALTGQKTIDVLATATGLRIIVHELNAGDDIAREGSGTIAAGPLSTNGSNISPLEKTSRTVPNDPNASGPTAAQIAALENGQTNPSPSPSPPAIANPNPAATPTAAATAPAVYGGEPNGSPDSSPDPNASPVPGPSAVPNPCTSGAVLPADICPKTTVASNGTGAPAGWKFGPRPTPTPAMSSAPNSRLIVIDPGHGGSDRGAMHGDLTEAVINLDMANRLRDILVSRGWEVKMTRTTDVDVYKPNDSSHDELQARVDVANNAGARLFVSVHSNSYINSTPNGTTTYYSKAIDVPFALAVQHDLAASLGTTDDGIIKMKFYVTLHTNMPAILVETAFLSNPSDYAKLTSSAWRQKVAEAIAAGIADFAGSPPPR